MGGPVSVDEGETELSRVRFGRNATPLQDRLALRPEAGLRPQPPPQLATLSAKSHHDSSTQEEFPQF